MKIQVVDGSWRDVRVVSTRRSVFGLFGRAAALGAVVVVGRGEADAKKGGRKQCKDRCTLEERCVKGKCVPKRRFGEDGELA